MNDYFNLLNEYQELQTNLKNQEDYKNTINDYIKTFINSISSLAIQDNKNDENLKEEESLFIFSNLYKNLINDLKKSILINFEIDAPLSEMYESQRKTMKKVFDSFNEIKNNLFEGKQKLNNAKKECLDFIKMNKEIEIIEKTDANLLYEAKKQNYFILYKYELDKMNEKIDKNNKKYNDVIDELDTIKMHKENTYTKVILEFGKKVGEIGNKFLEFSKNIKDKFSNILNQNLNLIKNNEIKIRFPKEEIDKQFVNLFENKNIQNNNEFNLLKNINNEQINNNNNNLISNNNNTNIEKENTGFDFEIIELSAEKEKIYNLMDEIIKKLNEKEEITPTEISEFLEDIKYDYSKYSLIFLEKIKKHYKNRIFSCKNKQNFIHLSNIINDLIIKEDDNKIYNEIFEISKMINYEGVFLSTDIQKKNPFLNTKTFWMNLIENNFITKLSEYACSLLKINVKSHKEMKIQKNETKKKEEKIEDALQNLYNRTYGYKKLNKKQKTQLEEQSQKIIFSCVSKSISYMCNFLVDEKSILNIISYYTEIFVLGIETLKYFQNLISVQFKKKYLKINQTHEEQKEKYGFFLNKCELAILNAAKFLPKEDYINIFKINKSIYSKTRTYLLKYQLTKFDISIEERLKIWEIFLKIDEIKKQYNYSELKKIYLEKKQFTQIFTLIDLDLSRTPLFREEENHKKIGSSILKCINIIESCIDYYQGINFVLLFLYQLLDYDEERTFYFILALETQTKYHELFENELSKLVIFFETFEKILEINLPDVYYSLLDKQIITQFYSTSWFITLFTSEVVKFQKENVPKFVLMAFESFIFGGWSGIINSGLALCYYNRDKILNFEGNELMKYMIAKINNINDISDEDFEKLHKLFLKNSEKINENFIRKLLEIIKFEKEYNQLKEQ